MQVGTTKDQGLCNKPSAAVHPGALAPGTLPQYNTIQQIIWRWGGPLVEQRSYQVSLQVGQDVHKLKYMFHGLTLFASVV